MKLTVLGEGAWGTAISHLLAQNGHEITLWCYDQSVARDIKVNRINTKFLPGIKLPANITATTDIQRAVDASNWIFEAIPVKFLRSTFESAKFNSTQTFVILSKGIENETLLFPSQIIGNIVGFDSKKIILSGPSFATLVAQEQFTGVNIASDHPQLCAELKNIIETNYFKTFCINDTIGLEVAGAVKNIIAVFCGMLDAAGYTENTKAFIITKSLQEFGYLIEMLGGKRETAYDLCGIGDLMLTSYGKLSKNLRLGEQLMQANLPGEAERSRVVEGLNTLLSIKKLIDQQNLNLPIISTVYNIVINSMPLAASLEALLESL